jgi:two-component system cell cycle response regulator
MEKKVLTIDDSSTLRKVVAKHLSSFDVRVIEAENGEEGVARARETSPDLILLDYNMPVMDGYHTLAELKTDPDLKPIPVVMLTTETAVATVMKLMKLGLKDYIAKPFTREILLQKINPILSLYDSRGAVPKAPEENADESVEAAPGKPTILAIDDKASILELLKEHLSEQFQLVTADCGRTALKAMAQNNIDYVFLDLSLPDISPFDVYDAYLKSKNKGASPKRVVAMSLRTAQADIRQATELGITAQLFKPFSRADVAMIVEQLVLGQLQTTGKKMHYLVPNGLVRVLECPSDRSSKYRNFVEYISSDVMREIDDMAEEGLTRLVIKVGEGFLTDLHVAQKFTDLVEHARQLALYIRLVADSRQVRDSLKQYVETADIPMDVSLECSLGAII